ncbi:hypothetical protein JYU14_02645 [Simkania negevensis]|uniref:Lipoprotein n=1 Tax=Simkania negevensis TaxID=83561 RepID=A0ABS3AQF1_9BACT|nr:hypothetical protein [Simkania negevensis]
MKKTLIALVVVGATLSLLPSCKHTDPKGRVERIPWTKEDQHFKDYWDAPPLSSEVLNSHGRSKIEQIERIGA